MSTETLTGYQVAKRANVRFKAEGLDEIPPQTVYQYIRQGSLKHVVVEGQKRVTVQVASAWIDKQVENRKRRAAEAEALESTDAVASDG